MMLMMPTTGGGVNRVIRSTEKFAKDFKAHEHSGRYGEKDPRRHIEAYTATTVQQVKASVPEWVKVKGQQAVEAAAPTVGTFWQDMKTIDNKWDYREYVYSGSAHALEAFGFGWDWTMGKVSDLTGADRAVLEVGEFFVPWSKLGKLGKFGKAAKAVDVASDVGRYSQGAEFAFKAQKRLGIANVDQFMMELGETAFLNKSPTKEIIRKRQPNILGKQVPLTKVDPTSTEWFRIGGGLDTELNKLLTIGKGKNKKLITLEELENLAKTKPGMQARLDKYKSLMATPPPSSAGDVLIYGYEDKLLARTSGLSKHADYIPAYHKSLEFHHASMKALEYSIHKKARELLQKGVITEADLVRLHNVGELKNIQSGSRAAAGIDMHRQTHNLLHKDIMLPKGIQPSHIRTPIKPLSSKPKNISSELWKKMKEVSPDITKFDTEYVTAWGDKGIEKWKKFRKTESYKLTSADSSSELIRLRNEIDSIDNIEDLINFRSDMIDNIVTPMTDEALLLERALDKLSTTEVLALDKNITPLKKARKMQKAQEKAKKTFKQEQTIEDAMKVAYD